MRWRPPRWPRGRPPSDRRLLRLLHGLRRWPPAAERVGPSGDRQPRRRLSGHRRGAVNWLATGRGRRAVRLLGGELTVDKRRKGVSARWSGGAGTGYGWRSVRRPGQRLRPGGEHAVHRLLGAARHRRQPTRSPRSPAAAGQGGGGSAGALTGVLMFDPAQHPDFKTIADIGRTDTRVLYFQGATYRDYLTGSGLLKRSQVDSGYAGTPTAGRRPRQHRAAGLPHQRARVREGAAAWNRRWPGVVADAGYPGLPGDADRPGRPEKELAPCLKRLVPLIQRSAAGYSPTPPPPTR